MPEPGAFAAAMMRDKRAPKHSRFTKALRREGVRSTAEFLRIKALPRRALDNSIDVPGLSAMLRLPDGDLNKCKGFTYDPITHGRIPCPYCVDGNAMLWEDQAYALKEIHDVGSAYIAMRAGGGKAWITLLGPVVQGARRPVLIMPSAVVDQTNDDVIPNARRHWRLPEHIIVTSYETLSSPRGKNFLHDFMPDVVHADEAHYLKTEDSARTLRFMRYFEDFPQVPLTIYTGTPQARSIKELAPLIKLALKNYSFLPDDETELDEWCCAIDADVDEDQRMGAGSLLEFAELMSVEDRNACRSELELARRAFFERARQTPGVVYSTGDAPNIPIKFQEHKPTISPVLREHFRMLRDDWKVCKGGDVFDEIADATHMYRAARQLSQGFFYRWIWPNNIPNLVWIEARKAWHQFVRRTILFRTSLTLDSYGEVEKACARGERYMTAKALGDRVTMALLKDTIKIDSHPYRNWLEIKPQYTPVKEVVWIDPFLVNEAATWARNSNGIVWCESEAFGEALASIGIPYYGGGSNAIINERRSCAAAIKAHSFGKNLQHFDSNFLATPSTNGKEFEQLLARTHRNGQKAPVVNVTLSLHVRELWQGWAQAVRDAEFMSGVGVEQRLTMPLCDLSGIEVNEDRAMQRIGSDDALWKYPERR